MTIKILIVDDSYFFRKRFCELFEDHPEISVVGTAVNGEDALQKVRSLRPDIITMDHEMPVMDGVTAVRRIMEQYPTPILMISALTYKGASVTLEALDAGALGFISKLSSDGSNPFLDKENLCEQIVQLVAARGSNNPNHPPQNSGRVCSKEGSFFPELRELELIVIGASTGGPIAVQELLTKLPADFPVPIVVAIHMPESFTQAYAGRLDKLCNIDVKEASVNDRLLPGQALIAPGGKMLEVSSSNNGSVRLSRKNRNYDFAPSIDYLFESAAYSYNKSVLAIVLTGMGSDGCEGSRKLRACNAAVWAQDEASSVIYGMPGVVAKENLANRILDIDEMVTGLKQLNG